MRPAPAGSSRALGVYGGTLGVPLDSYIYGIGDQQILSTLFPGGKERMRRLMEPVRCGCFAPAPLSTHRFALD